jgi:hypothetical protein
MLTPLSEIGTTCFSSCCDIESAIIFTSSFFEFHFRVSKRIIKIVNHKIVIKNLISHFVKTIMKKPPFKLKEPVSGSDVKR